ncbi:cysteine-rich VLP protein, partial [Hungatella hathewayi]|uniref:cysteine-rich VLP protein n=1 Tax=Hungatella hathewayi TaxID=154046 RepID=UPI003D811470
MRGACQRRNTPHPDGSLYRMTPAQRKQAASLIRRECCCCEDGNCIVLDDGDTCTC